MNLKEQREQALKAARAIGQKARAENRGLTPEEYTEAKGHLDEVERLSGLIEAGEKSDDLLAQLAEAGEQGPERERQAGGAKARDLGTHFINHMKSHGLSLKTPGTINAPEFKANTDTQATGGQGGAYGPLLTEVDRSFVLPVRQRLVIADLLQAGTVGGTAITYPVFGALEGGTGFVAEGGGKPQMHVADPTWRTDALGEVAGWFKMTDDMAEDLEYVVSEINSTALYDLALKEEAAILNGNGTSPNLRGILQRSGIQTHLMGTDTPADAIFKAISKVQTGSGFSADGIAINPIDYEALRLGKDGNGQYFGGGYFAGQYGNGGVIENPPLWGLRTVVTTAVAAGSPLVGAFASAKVFRKGGIRVESTNSHEDDFTNDKITVRVRERLGLQVKYPAAFVAVSLSAA